MKLRNQSLIKKVTERDGRCVLCGATKDLVAHHITPLTDGGLDTIDNMVTLCEKHHWLYHNWPKDEISGTKALVNRGMDRKAKKGYVQYKAPLGYIHKDGKLILDEEKAELVRSIFDEYIKEKNITRIAKRYGLSRMQIYRILKNETYLGKVKWKDNVIDGTHGPLVGAETFDAVRCILEKKRKR